MNDLQPIANPQASPFMLPELVASAEPEDDRVWVPQSQDNWFRPLLLDRVHNVTVNVLKTRAKGVVSRHYHTGTVHGYVIRGSWRYLEHDWIARPGSYVFEPPGETHTLVMDGLAEEMMTLFVVNGALIHVDAEGKPVGFADVFQKIEMCDAYYRRIGLGPDFIKQFIR